MQKSTRLPEFDIAKAIAFLAVILGHSSFAGVPQSIVDFCFSFHMPLFFIVSGYFLNSKSSCTSSFIKKNIRGLVIPYSVTSIFIVVLATLFTKLFQTGSVSTAIQRWLPAAIYGSGVTSSSMPTGIEYIGAIWFLLALFWAKIIACELNRTNHALFYSLILFVIGIRTSEYVWLPWSIQPAFCATMFLIIGQIVKSENLLEKNGIPTTIWLCLLFAWLYCGCFYGHLSMASNYYPDGAIDVIGGVSGSLCLIKASSVIKRLLPNVSLGIAKIGSITLPLLCAHIIELDAFPWQSILNLLSRHFQVIWPFVFALQVIFTLLIALLIYFSPRALSTIFYPSRRRQ